MTRVAQGPAPILAVESMQHFLRPLAVARRLHAGHYTLCLLTYEYINSSAAVDILTISRQAYTEFLSMRTVSHK
jgi:hypothetical protein